MRKLFELDMKDYNEHGTRFVIPSVRGIIICSGRIAMVHSLKYNYYKFPGGGAENEAEENFTLELVSPVHAITANRAGEHGPKDQVMIEREVRVLELLIQENYFEAER